MAHDAHTHSALMDMMRHDPDGGTVEPTDQDYARFESWAIEAYGRDMWTLYNGDTWLERPEV